MTSSGSALRLVQRLVTREADKFEGVGFSPSGDILAVAAPGDKAVLLYQRGADGLMEDKPYFRIEGLGYPHDVAFTTCGSSELMAIAQRVGKVSIWQRHSRNQPFTPAFEISGPQAHLHFIDGAAFLPNADYVVAASYSSQMLTFFKRRALSPLRFDIVPDFIIKHESIDHPDGLAFSSCGRWLATTNHGSHSVAVFRRCNRLLSAGKLQYGPNPVCVIKDPEMRHPHSVAFMPRTNDLIMTNAGANFFALYPSRRRGFARYWDATPRWRHAFCEPKTFASVNSANGMEGGPKGIAIHGETIAACSPEMGVEIYSLTH